jgi:hypothetical protein
LDDREDDRDEDDERNGRTAHEQASRNATYPPDRLAPIPHVRNRDRSDQSFRSVPDVSLTGPIAHPDLAVWPRWSGKPGATMVRSICGRERVTLVGDCRRGGDPSVRVPGNSEDRRLLTSPLDSPVGLSRNRPTDAFKQADEIRLPGPGRRRARRRHRVSRPGIR